MKKTLILLTAMLALATEQASAELTRICEMKDRGIFNFGGKDLACKTFEVQGPFDQECRTPTEVTFKTNGPILDYARDQYSDFPVGRTPSVLYTVEVGIAGIKNSVLDARFLTLRRTDPNGKTKISGCKLFTTSEGDNYVDRHHLRFIERNGNSYLFEVRQNTEARARIVIEDKGSVMTLHFVDEEGRISGADLLGFKAKVVYSTAP